MGADEPGRDIASGLGEGRKDGESRDSAVTLRDERVAFLFGRVFGSDEFTAIAP